MIRRRGAANLAAGQGRGFTVVEVLIAAAIVVVGLLALATMFPTGYSTVTKSGIQSCGLALAQQRIELLRNTPYNNIAEGTTTESCSGYLGYTRATVVTENPTVNGTQVTGAKLVAVTVTLPTAGAPASQPIQLTTIVAK